MLLNRISIHGLSALALGQVALTVVRLLGVIGATVALIALFGLNPTPTILCVSTSYLCVVIVEAVWVGRRVLHQSQEADVAGSLS